MKISKKLRRFAALAVIFAVLSSGCSGAMDAVQGLKSSMSSDSLARYEIPAFRDAVYHPDKAKDYGVIRFDDSESSLGYVAIQAEHESRLKLIVSCGDMSYNYDIPNNGETVIIPMNMGNGEYNFRLMDNVEGNKYAETWSDDRFVKLENEFEGFLRPSQMVNYSAGSDCVAKARALASNCFTDADVASAIYTYVTTQIKYDYDKAEMVRVGYLPDPDTTMAVKKGICFDYASLSAAMMRSMGIPCKLITGYANGDIFHAWNVFYLENQGWITIEIKAYPQQWQRIDTTFAAAGTRAQELLEDSRYVQLSVY